MARVFSRFEFWPTWLMYLPVAVIWLGLAFRHRSLTLPLLANPSIPTGGMVGSPKSQLFDQAQGLARTHILDWLAVTVTDKPCQAQAQSIVRQAAELGIRLPFVAKPDIGCRGAGVHCVNSAQALESILVNYRPGSTLLCQALSAGRYEAGIFFVRDPVTGIGSVTSMAWKVIPTVTGTGEHTLAELVKRDPRASRITHLYQARNADIWHRVVPSGVTKPLLFSVVQASDFLRVQ